MVSVIPAISIEELLNKAKERERIAIIGSTQYRTKMEAHKEHLLDEGDEARMPAFDDDIKDGLKLIERNRELIEWADRVHVFWDCRSVGTIFDWGMAFGLHKPLKIIHMANKTLVSVMKQYAELSKEEND